MTKQTCNIVPMRRRSMFVTASDTFDIDALIGELDGQGANSTSYKQGVIRTRDGIRARGGRRIAA